VKIFATISMLLCVSAHGYWVAESDVFHFPQAAGSAADDYYFMAGNSPTTNASWTWRHVIPSEVVASLPCDVRIYCAGKSVKSANGVPISDGRFIVEFPVLAGTKQIAVTFAYGPKPAVALVDRVEYGVQPRPASPPSIEGRPDLVIVAAQAFRPAADALAALRRDEGLAVRVVDAEDIYSVFGKSATALRDFLKTFETAPRYLCILGAGSLGNGSPSFKAAGIAPAASKKYQQGQYGSDVLVGLDAPIGDLDGDGCPDVAVGRIPAQTPSLALAAVKRIGFFDSYPAAIALFVSDKGYAASAAKMATNWTGAKIMCRRESATNDAAFKKVVLGYLNSGGVRVAVYVGHGNNAAIGVPYILSAGEVGTLTKTIIFVASACQTADFADPTTNSVCFNERLIQSGPAVATVGSALETNLPDGEKLVAAILRSERIGDGILAACRERCKGAMPWTAETDVLLGDPTMRIK
jgi:hypothetical protein